MAAYIARVLLFDADPAKPINFDAKLIARGYHVMRADSAEQILEMAGAEHPDIIIINTPPNGDKTAVINAWNIRKVPLILIGDRADVEARAGAERRCRRLPAARLPGCGTVCPHRFPAASQYHA